MRVVCVCEWQGEVSGAYLYIGEMCVCVYVYMSQSERDGVSE